MSDQLVLETNGLTKTYNGVNAVNQVNMHIQKGDIYGFVGENGAGKTTIIRIVAGLARPTSGTFSLYGIPNTDPKINQVKAKIGGIVEAVSLNRSLTAIENLLLQCKIAGVKKTNEELKQLLERVGLGDVAANKKAGQFSLGMRQRLGIASVLLSNPDFILLDEPMNGLDPQGFIDMRELIQKLNNEGVTFLISSHILSELDKVCTRVGFIRHGELLEELSIEELRDKSKRKLVISSKNIGELHDILKKEVKTTSMVVNEKEVILYDDFDINATMKAIVKNNIQVDSFNVIEETIEDYYAHLMIRGKQQ